MKSRAPESDLSDWAELTGDDSWSYDNMLPYFHRLENVTRDEGAQPNPDRGYEGIIPVRHRNISIIHYHTGLLKANNTNPNQLLKTLLKNVNPPDWMDYMFRQGSI